MAQFAVIGLGMFGSAASLELTRLGHSVIGVDSNAKLVSDIADHLTYAAVADARDEQALKELNIQDCDSVLVTIGENLEASILCVLHLRTLGIRDIWVKAASREHHLILSRLGVKRIIHPEEEMGIRVAQALNYPMMNQYMPLGADHYIVEVEVVEEMTGHSLVDLLKGAQDSVKPLLVRRKKEIHAPLAADFTLQTGDWLVLAGPLDKLRSLASRM